MDPQALSERVRRVRVPLNLAVGGGLLSVLRPSSPSFLWSGLGLALGGEALRIWAAASLMKDKALGLSGPYRLVRHPLYLGSALIAAGGALALTAPAEPARNLLLWGPCALLFVWVYRHAVRSEEAHLGRLFGEEFQRYAREVPAVLPDPRRLPEAVRTTRMDLGLLRRNRELRTLGALLLAGLLLRLRLEGP